MKRFLCPVHKKWLTLHPMEAHIHLQQSHQQGVELRQQGQWQRALDHLGCAYEIACLLLDFQRRRRDNLLLQFTSSAILFADCWHKLDDNPAASSLLASAKARLEDAQTRMSHSVDCLRQCTDALHSGVQYFATTAGFDGLRDAGTMH